MRMHARCKGEQALFHPLLLCLARSLARRDQMLTFSLCFL
jgi:hypothetical protein